MKPDQQSEILQQDKAEEVGKLQAQDKKVAIVGDGVNDVPALAQAEVGMPLFISRVKKQH